MEPHTTTPMEVDGDASSSSKQSLEGDEENANSQPEEQTKPAESPPQPEKPAVETASSQEKVTLKHLY